MKKTDSLVWISTEKGYPRRFVPILLYNSRYWNFFVTDLCGYEWSVSEGDDGYQGSEITHWAYLPVAPGEDISWVICQRCRRTVENTERSVCRDCYYCTNQ